MDGEFFLTVKNAQNKLVFSYIGYTRITEEIGKNTNFKIAMEESNANSLKEVEVKGKITTNTGTMPIPTREISTAMQKIDAKEFEGIQVGSVDEALQGRVAGLDIVGNSGAPGTGMSMRIRGTSSIMGNAQPLIVVNGVPLEINMSSDFDFASAKEEQYANLLNVNTDDILDVVVLKDAASTAIWGSRGANGVLQITTKKGSKGKSKLEVNYKLTASKMPQAPALLNGDDYTMLMKEAYLNPTLNNSAGNIFEFNYDPAYSQYWNYNNNTDWVKAVSQTGWTKDLYVTLSGGQDRGDYRVTFGHKNQTGTLIGQSLESFSNRTDLRYKLSDRLIFTSEFAYSYDDNNKNYSDDPNKSDVLLGIAIQKMPNVPIFSRDQSGNYTDVYFNINQRTSGLGNDQRYLFNPVALAKLAKYNEKTYRILPTFRLQYDFTDPDKQMLRYNGYISMDAYNKRTNRFLPKEVLGGSYDESNVNYAFNGDEESLNIQTDNNLTWMPHLGGGHSLMLYGSVQTKVSTSGSQSFGSYWSPNNSIQTVYGGSKLSSIGSTSMEGRSYGILLSTHYAFKERYILDLILRRDASSRFGPSSRVGYFPGVSGKWIISDESFMKPLKFINMLAIRPSWGVSGNQPDKEYLYYSRYSNYSNPYMDMAGVYESSLQLDKLRWEKTTQANLGVDLALFQNRLNVDMNVYHKRTTDLLFPNFPEPSTSGFGSVSWANSGTMDNNGWEINFSAPNVFKIGKLSIDMTMNLSNYYNTIQDFSDKLSLSSGDVTTNGQYLRNIVIGNSLGSFYGYKYKGVYQYNTYVKGTQESAPIARDASGNPILDASGKPKPMYFNYGGSNAYVFKGGDAIYEDINHDGSIDKSDVVYLGNANPILNGGFGVRLHYQDFSLNFFFVYRVGNKIVNEARMYAENMYSSLNQSVAVNWRWRKDGDVTNMPRALYQTGYNWLGSDRYVEDGSFLRWKYVTLNYSVPKPLLKPIGLSSIKFYMTVNNLLIFTKYTGVDPEIGYSGAPNEPFKIGYDNARTPRSRDLTVGLSVGF